ncbi:hypothetical protein [Cognatilysobacter lacus]|uniref:Uncharacterized protein n=1 Tax=Cognatilysobacter lacus TaxID=1643323 RepID=A0A5D8YXW8_9GAMM|nr:hypothetical protein [Lysobacter lacus]TZF87299.1 hypothetical protein FW784_11325 [Lysobacter lacus]
MTGNKSRAVLTIATGKRLYLDMAIALARSFLWWHRDSDIAFYIATDIPDEMPRDLGAVRMLRFEKGELGVGFSMKLKLDQLAPAEQTLFIDSDCLCLGPLDPLFDRFEGNGVSVLGTPTSEGEWFGDIATQCANFGVPALPRFNGGVYYLEKGERRNAVYEKARELEPRYDELGLVRLRGSANEELLMSISMALHGCPLIEDDGTFYGDFFMNPVLLELDLLRGKVCLSNPPPPHPSHRPGYACREIHPRIVHFLGDFTSKWPYRTEEKTLALIGRGVPAGLARLVVRIGYRLPAMVAQRARDSLRPIYRRVFGYRAVRHVERV